jgi:hypothetical protein
MQMLTEKEKPRIEYWLFQKLILDFQLRSHEKYLKRFIQLFRTVDQDHNGIINEVLLISPLKPEAVIQTADLHDEYRAE